MTPGGAPARSVFAVDGPATLTLGQAAFVRHPDLGTLPLDAGAAVDLASPRLELGPGSAVRVARGTTVRRAASPSDPAAEPAEPVLRRGATTPVAGDQSIELHRATLLPEGVASVPLASGRRLRLPEGSTVRLGRAARLDIPPEARGELEVREPSVVTDAGFVIERCRAGPCANHGVPGWLVTLSRDRHRTRRRGGCPRDGRGGPGRPGRRPREEDTTSGRPGRGLDPQAHRPSRPPSPERGRVGGGWPDRSARDPHGLRAPGNAGSEGRADAAAGDDRRLGEHGFLPTTCCGSCSVGTATGAGSCK